MEQQVTAEDLAARLGTTGKQLRGWRRREAARGHELLRAHQHGENWVFTRYEADQLAAEYRRAH